MAPAVDIGNILYNLRYLVKMDYDANNNLIFLGDAIPGSVTSAAVWRIRKMTYDANNNITDIEWADGNSEFDNAWDDRTTLSYS